MSEREEGRARLGFDELLRPAIGEKLVAVLSHFEQDKHQVLIWHPSFPLSWERGRC
jgi:hypothetical protein